MNMKNNSINNFISYFNRNKVVNAIGYIWLLGLGFSMLNLFCLHSQYKPFNTIFFYYVTPIYAIVMVIWMLTSFRQFKKIS